MAFWAFVSTKSIHGSDLSLVSDFKDSALTASLGYSGASIANIQQLGDSNFAAIAQSGSANIAAISQLGSNNQAISIQSSNLQLESQLLADYRMEKAGILETLKANRLMEQQPEPGYWSDDEW